MRGIAATGDEGHLLLDGDPRTVVTTARTAIGRGRLGHEMKNIIAGMLIAALNNWSYLAPSSTGRAHGFEDVDGVISLRKLAPLPWLRLGLGDERSEWRKYGTCPPGWRVVHLNETRYTGFDQWEEARDYIEGKVRHAEGASSPSKCIVTAQGFRIHMHQVLFALLCGNSSHPAHTSVSILR